MVLFSENDSEERLLADGHVDVQADDRPQAIEARGVGGQDLLAEKAILE
jgi:hypothetical protein